MSFFSTQRKAYIKPWEDGTDINKTQLDDTDQRINVLDAIRNTACSLLASTTVDWFHVVHGSSGKRAYLQYR